MAIPEGGKSGTPDGKAWGLCRLPFWQSGGGGGNSGGNNSLNNQHNASSSSSSNNSSSNLPQSVSGHRHHHQQHQRSIRVDGSRQVVGRSSSVSSMVRSLLLRRRRLRLDPAKKLYFPYEPGKQVRSAIKIKNTSKSLVAFKVLWSPHGIGSSSRGMDYVFMLLQFQTTAPKSCFMRPPGGILSPGESLIATVFKFVEHPENNEKQKDQKSKDKFKIVSLKVKEPMEYVPEMFDEQKDQVAVEQILRVVFLDVDRPSPQMEKLKRQLVEAEAALEARKKPPEDAGPRLVGEGLVIDEWKERRERYLARQQVEGVDSV
ncbi:Vesicle-associated protein 4-1 [Acorus calamus]|uniref:Vesicle-associated protein 4-1 n=1 Tax=Acorus calamus TaxID=4465 RepID=A0AAV9DWT0_ACOCL|nr:Vesicle-associated protein 4-1 [Acorus calamus]